MKKSMKIVVPLVLFVALASHAAAYEEVPAGIVVAPADAPLLVDPAAGADTEGAADGTSIVLPGLGKLPKLNFGLELLYGDEAEAVVEEETTDDLLLRGAIKHTF